MQTSKLQKLLEQKVTRRQFLQYIGLAIAATFGMNTIISILSQQENKQTSRYGFGGGKFGV
jgi:hypothetical protein